MVKIQNQFKRYEIKYLLDARQYESVRRTMQGRTVGDEYGKSTICNIYYDTPDRRLIRRSLEKPVYKEKMRLRSYGTPHGDDRVFLELKKKYESVVYKRRADMTLDAALRFTEAPEPYSQITREIAYFIDIYGSLYPAMFISYSREAFFGADDRDLRITFDTDILWRESEVDLTAGAYGTPLLPAGTVLMELKIASAVPLWFSSALAREKIYPVSFSKYGRAYIDSMKFENKSVRRCEIYA